MTWHLGSSRSCNVGRPSTNQLTIPASVDTATAVSRRHDLVSAAVRHGHNTYVLYQLSLNESLLWLMCMENFTGLNCVCLFEKDIN